MIIVYLEQEAGFLSGKCKEAHGEQIKQSKNTGKKLKM